MGFFDFLWGGDKKRESEDASSGYVPGVFGSDDSDSDSSGSDGSADAGGSSGDGGGGGDGGGV